MEVHAEASGGGGDHARCQGFAAPGARGLPRTQTCSIIGQREGDENDRNASPVLTPCQQSKVNNALDAMLYASGGIGKS